ncbi:MAG TPA: superoxide dismutase family protein [Allosphingosinicella sp.]|nr:superoxide dismutase family protein [Allosphingosinicella sp.]
MNARRLGATAALASLAACQPIQDPYSAGEGAPPTPATITAELRDAAGQIVGTASATQDGSTVMVRIEGTALPPGYHGTHIHTTGTCTPPDFESAGPHWNPTRVEHGSLNRAGKHKGDLPNLQIRPNGRGVLQYEIPGARLAAIDDADGAALVVHAQPDDHRTDPSGNSGARIACGVFG